MVKNKYSSQLFVYFIAVMLTVSCGKSSSSSSSTSNSPGASTSSVNLLCLILAPFMKKQWQDQAAREITKTINDTINGYEVDIGYSDSKCLAEVPIIGGCLQTAYWSLKGATLSNPSIDNLDNINVDLDNCNVAIGTGSPPVVHLSVSGSSIGAEASTTILPTVHPNVTMSVGVDLSILGVPKLDPKTGDLAVQINIAQPGDPSVTNVEVTDCGIFDWCDSIVRPQIENHAGEISSAIKNALGDKLLNHSMGCLLKAGGQSPSCAICPACAGETPLCTSSGSCGQCISDADCPANNSHCVSNYCTSAVSCELEGQCF